MVAFLIIAAVVAGVGLTVALMWAGADAVGTRRGRDFGSDGLEDGDIRG